MGGTRPADRPASAGRWGRQASTDHSHEDGEGAVDAVLFTVQDPRTARHRRVPTAHDQRQRQKTAKHEGAGYRYISDGREVASSGDWDSGSQAFTVSLGSRSAPSLAPGHGRCFTGMLFSPRVTDQVP